MHVFATVPLAGYDRSVADRYRAMISDLADSGGDLFGKDYYFVRTWDRATSEEYVQLSLFGPDAQKIRDVVSEMVRKHDFEPVFSDVDPDSVESPLWNAGFGGESFDAVSKALYRQASPLLVALAARARTGVMDSYRLALRFMVEHEKATLVNSEQRTVGSFSFNDLLSTRLLSFRSHYEAIAARASDPHTFEQGYAKYYDVLGEFARECITASLDSTEPLHDDPALRQWAENIAANTSSLRENFRVGKIINNGLTLDDLNREREVPLSPTQFHAFGEDSAAFQDLMQRNPDFLAFRLQASLMYSCLHTLGFSLLERFLFCYILGRANEEVYGKSATELQIQLRTVAEALAAQPSR